MSTNREALYGNPHRGWHRPRWYRYRVAAPKRIPRPRLNRYGWDVIGVAVVVGRYAYCLKWKWAA